MVLVLQFVVLAATLQLIYSQGKNFVPAKKYQCVSGICELLSQDRSPSPLMSQSTCLMMCGQGSIWPYPNGVTSIEEKFELIDFGSVGIVFSGGITGVAASIADNAFTSFRDNVSLKKKKRQSSSHGVNQLKYSIHIDIVDPAVAVADFSVDESYSLTTRVDGSTVTTKISSNTVFGARHALETLSQLLSWEQHAGSFAVASSVSIQNDGPQFRYRGLMLDLSRHFFSVSKIKQTIKAMSYNKLNVLHLHISDTASFPVALQSEPNITSYGAYSDEEVYTTDDLRDISEFANLHGVIVLPELDGPAHVASGFQWGPAAGLGELSICTDPEGVKQAAWTESGLGPPTGQLNLGNANIYPVLAKVHQEIIAAFPLSSHFHVGGDEIMVGSDEAWASCYNSTEKAADIVALLQQKGWDRSDPQSFYQLWKDYNAEIADIVRKSYSASPRPSSLQKMHIWGGSGFDATGVTYNMMTQTDVTAVLPPSKYVIQVWDSSQGSIVPSLLQQGYEVVLSNTDYVYLDCGNAGWAHPGGYWCQPYHEWQRMYDYVLDVQQLWNITADSKWSNVLGSETLAWSEMISDINLDQKVWPRTAALAEALWGRVTTATTVTTVTTATASPSSPSSPSGTAKGASWFAADPRMQYWTSILQQRGIDAEPLQTRWCEQRGAYACTVNSGTPQ